MVAVIGWFGAPFTGRLPGFAIEFLTGYLRWTTRVNGYARFLTGRYPPFSMEPSEEYPIDVVVQGGRLNRWAVLFRIILSIPANIVATVVSLGLGIFSIILWFTALFTGRLPPSFFEATAAAARYRVRYTGYFLMLTSVYPGGLFGDQPGPAAVTPVAPSTSAAPAPAWARPPVAPAWVPPAAESFDPSVTDRSASPWSLVLSKGGRTLLLVIIIIIVLGAIGYVADVAVSAGSSSTNTHQPQSQASSAHGAVTSTSRMPRSRRTRMGSPAPTTRRR